MLKTGKEHLEGLRDGRTVEEFPATQALAILPVPKGDLDDFMRREFRGTTRFRIPVSAANGGYAARVEERHSANLTYRSASGQRVIRQASVSYRSGETKEFGSGTTCRSSGELRALLQ